MKYNIWIWKNREIMLNIMITKWIRFRIFMEYDFESTYGGRDGEWNEVMMGNCASIIKYEE